MVGVAYWIFAVLIGLAKVAQPRFQECLGNICERYNDISGSSFAFSCEPRNMDINLAALAKLKVDPPDATCGDEKMEFCGLKNPLSCMTCDNSRDDQRHPLESMVDDIKWTWWQSKLWPGRINKRYEVNITINLPKTFLLTDDIDIEFHDGKPQRMLVEKSNDDGKTWKPLQYFAEDCQAQFHMDSVDITSPLFQLDSIMTPICTQKFSVNSRWQMEKDVVTVYILSKMKYLQRDGFNQTALCYTMNDPGKYLQSFLTITNLRIRLIRPPMVQPEGGLNADYERTQHYGIKKILMKGRCFCNGHASDCDVNVQRKSANCRCKHFTRGKNCERCESLYWMQPWKPGMSYFLDLHNERWTKQLASRRQKQNDTSSPATLWQPKTHRRSGSLICKCNGHSKRCENTETSLYGVLCVDCRHNTIGKHCHRCKNGFYPDKSKLLSNKDYCRPCYCSQPGSKGWWCQPAGQCKCRPNFVGRTCAKCKTGFMFKKNSCIPTTVANCPTVTKPCSEVTNSNDTTNCVALDLGLCSCVDAANCPPNLPNIRIGLSQQPKGNTAPRKRISMPFIFAIFLNNVKLFS